MAGRSADELPFEDRTVPRMVELGAARWGGRRWIRYAGEDVTYAGAPERFARVAGGLAAAGVRPGDRVAVLAANRMELADLIFGAAWLGAVVVPVNVATRGAQLEHVLANAEPALVVVEADLRPLVEGVAAHVWTLDAPLPVGEPRAPHPARPADPFAILYTSGTTGPAKGVVCPHAQFYWWGLLTGRCLGVSGADRLYTTLPLFHTNAINALFQALLAGASYELGARFSASRFWDEVRAGEATVTYLLGAMVSILLRQPEREEDRDHHVRIALAPATPVETAQAFTERFGPVTLLDGYGSTETNMILANTLRGHRPGSMGWPLDEFEARVADADDRPVPPGTAGELLLRAREPFSFALGYWRNDEATVAAWRNLWFHTGDRVVQEEDGSFRFLDRLNDAIRRRGENVSSWEVEQALESHADVAAAAAVPVPSELGDDEVLAYVVARAGAELDFEALVRWCEPRLAYYAVPRYLERLAELPLTENGKVRKALLRARGVGEATWDREAAGVELARR